jgi:hypothetical protein
MALWLALMVLAAGGISWVVKRFGMPAVAVARTLEAR